MVRQKTSETSESARPGSERCSGKTLNLRARPNKASEWHGHMMSSQGHEGRLIPCCKDTNELFSSSHSCKAKFRGDIQVMKH